MEKIVIDGDVAAQLDRTDQKVVLADASGRMLGYFLSPDVYFRMLPPTTDAEPTREEIEEARADYRKNGGYTTQQVLDHLADIKRWFEEHPK